MTNDKLHPGNPALDFPALDIKTASRILNTALEENNMDPSSIPLDILEAWGNYNKAGFRIAKKVCYILLIATLLLPLLFFRPQVVASRVDVTAEYERGATYGIDIGGLLPVRNVTARLNDNPLNVHQDNAKKFQTKVFSNGDLVITAVSINGQITSKEYTVDYIDNEKPTYLGSKVSGNHVFISVEDSFSGIDYDSVEGLTPISIDEETGTFEFKIPNKLTTITIYDNSGNSIQMIVSSDQQQ